MKFSTVVLSLATLVSSALALNAFSAPLGNETLTAGQPFIVRWNNTGGGETVDLVLKKGPPNNLQTALTIAQNLANQGAVRWHIPEDLVTGNDYALEITDKDSGDVNYSPMFAISGVEPTSTTTTVTSTSTTSTSTSTTETETETETTSTSTDDEEATSTEEETSATTGATVIASGNSTTVVTSGTASGNSTLTATGSESESATTTSGDDEEETSTSTEDDEETTTSTSARRTTTTAATTTAAATTTVADNNGASSLAFSGLIMALAVAVYAL